VSLTRGLSADASFEKWTRTPGSARWPTPVRRVIIVFDYEGNALKRYKLTNCWPKSLEIGFAEGRRHERPDREVDAGLRGHRAGGLMRRGLTFLTPRFGSGALSGGGAAGLRTEFDFVLPRGTSTGPVRCTGKGRCASPPPGTSSSPGRRPGPGARGVPHDRAPGPGHHPAGTSMTSTRIVENMFARVAFLQELNRASPEGHPGRGALPACQHGVRGSTWP